MHDVCRHLPALLFGAAVLGGCRGIERRLGTNVAQEGACWHRVKRGPFIHCKSKQQDRPLQDKRNNSNRKSGYSFFLCNVLRCTRRHKDVSLPLCLSGCISVRLCLSLCLFLSLSVSLSLSGGTGHAVAKSHYRLTRIHVHVGCAASQRQHHSEATWLQSAVPPFLQHLLCQHQAGAD